MFTIFTIFRPKPRLFLIYFYPALGLKTANTKGNFFTKLSNEGKRNNLVKNYGYLRMLNMKCVRMYIDL